MIRSILISWMDDMAEYAASINLLSQCNSLIASGGCGGVDEALRENAGGYEHVYVFDLGTNR